MSKKTEIVTSCKNCVYCKLEDERMRCSVLGNVIEGNDFCSCGMEVGDVFQDIQRCENRVVEVGNCKNCMYYVEEHEACEVHGWLPKHMRYCSYWGEICESCKI